MLVERGLPQANRIPGQRPVVTIGNFDGVHQGHQALLSHVVRRAREIDGTAVALTFHPHPKGVIGAGAPPLINTLDQRIELIERLDIDLLYIIPFDEQLAKHEAIEFVDSILWEGTRLKELIVGYDFRFGRGGKGHYDLLIEEGKRLGFDVLREGATQIAGRVVSSTLVREALIAGDLDEANLLLGRDYFIDGAVVHGHNRGKTFGYPTANLKPVNEIIPARGIYATWVNVGEEFFYGATNIGFNPTFGDKELSIETFLLDFEGDLYGKPLRLHFTKRLRDELKFESVEALTRQIDQDVADVRQLFRRGGTPLERRR